MSTGKNERGGSRHMDFGLAMAFANPRSKGVPAARFVESQFRQAVLAEELGFDHIWGAQHPGTDQYYPAPFPLLAAIPARAPRAAPRPRVGDAARPVPRGAAGGRPRPSGLLHERPPVRAPRRYAGGGLAPGRALPRQPLPGLQERGRP